MRRVSSLAVLALLAAAHASATARTPESAMVVVAPCRLVDTRSFPSPYGPPALAPLAPRSFVIAGQCGVPLDATAVQLNVIATGTLGAGHIKVYPTGGAAPATSTLNYGSAGQTIANAAVSALGSGSVNSRRAATAPTSSWTWSASTAAPAS
jgi:hypothetical protein